MKAPAVPAPPPLSVIPFTGIVEGVPLADLYPLRDVTPPAEPFAHPAFEVTQQLATGNHYDVVMRPKLRDVDLLTDADRYPTDARASSLAEFAAFTQVLAPWCGAPANWQPPTITRDEQQFVLERQGTTGDYGLVIVRAIGARPGYGPPVPEWRITCDVYPGVVIQRAIETFTPEQNAQLLAHPALVVHEHATRYEGRIGGDDGCAYWRAQGQACDPIPPPRDNFYADTGPVESTRDRRPAVADLAQGLMLVHGWQRTCDGRTRLTVKLVGPTQTTTQLESLGGNRAARTLTRLATDAVLLDTLTGEQLELDGPRC